ncbi:MAG: protein-export chaperone SecB [Clostridia bacterium]|nr:protein-export chaperone SecB [Clostridia bacterium]
MEKYESVLKFIRYEVNEIYFKKNINFQLSEDGTPIGLKIKPTIDIKDKNMNITLQIIIFENAEQNNKPFEMKINLTGYFIAEGCNPEAFKVNAIAILYPYVRAIVSTYTANANITPLILPTINVNKLIEDQEQEN